MNLLEETFNKYAKANDEMLEKLQTRIAIMEDIITLKDQQIKIYEELFRGFYRPIEEVESDVKKMKEKFK